MCVLFGDVYSSGSKDNLEGSQAVIYLRQKFMTSPWNPAASQGHSNLNFGIFDFPAVCVQVKNPRGEPEDDRTCKNVKHIFAKGRNQDRGIPCLRSVPAARAKHREVYRGTNISLIYAVSGPRWSWVGPVSQRPRAPERSSSQTTVVSSRVPAQASMVIQADMFGAKFPET